VVQAPHDVAVVGGGVVGLAAAWRLAGSGASVVLVDDGGPAASHVAAGMLAPVTEAAFGEEALLRLNLVALRGYRAFVADLDRDGGPPVRMREDGTLSVGVTADDRTELAHLTAFRDELGLRTTTLSGRETRRLEPYLATTVGGGVLAVDDLSVNNRSLRESLRRNVTAASVQVVDGGAVALLVDAGRAVGVSTADGSALRARTVVLAAGARSALLHGVPPAARPPVVPVKGHVLRLGPMPGRPATAPVTRTVRAVVEGHEVYLVPRSDGELVVGATVEHHGHDLTVSAGAVRELLRSAQDVLPVVDELSLKEVATGLRPGTPDNAPVVGWSALPGLFVATGHYRNGILLCGLTGDEVARQVSGQAPSEAWVPFSPNRFATQEVMV
jgi:glycine oxidase